MTPPGGIMVYLERDEGVDTERVSACFFGPTQELGDAYSRYIDAEGATFLRQYFASLKLDLELALMGEETARVRATVLELSELICDLKERIGRAKGKEEGACRGRLPLAGPFG